MDLGHHVWVSGWRRRLAKTVVALCLVSIGAFAEPSPALATTYYPGNPVQVGTASTDSTDANATGTQAYLGHWPSPESIPDASNTGLFWWLGIDLSDGSFLQTGIATDGGWGCSSNYGVFTYAFNPMGQAEDQWGGQSAGTCGTYITTYGQFDIQSTVLCGTCYPIVYGWKYYEPFNGYGNNQVYETLTSTSGSNKPGVVMELSSGSGTPNEADEMGPAGAWPATATQHGIGNGYYATLSANGYYDHTSCNPPNVVGEDQGYNSGYPNRAGVGTGLLSYPCTGGSTHLWP